MEPITARFNWTSDDLINGRRHFEKSRDKTSIRILVLVAISYWGYQIQGSNMTNKHTWVFVGLIVGLIGLGVLIGIPVARWTSKYIIRREFAKRPDANMEIVWTISDQGIQTSTTVSKGEIQWGAFQKVIFTPAGFLFMPSAKIFHILPTRAFSSQADIENLKTLARAHVAVFKELK